MKMLNRTATVLIGDMRKLRKMPSFKAHFPFVFADPPYNIGQDYGKTYKDRMPKAAFAQFLDEVCDALYYVTTAAATVCILISEKHTEDVGRALSRNGFHRRRIICWHETFGVYQRQNYAESVRFIHYAVRNPAHYVFNADSIRVPSARQSRYNDRRADPRGRIPDNLFTDSRICGTFKEKIKDTPCPNQLPESLVTKLVLCHSHPCEPVLDPFVGTGTTGSVCAKHNRPFTGIEINPIHARIAARRIGCSCSSLSKGQK